MRVLYRSHTQPTRTKFANQIDNQSGLAGVFKAGNAEYLQDGLATHEIHQPADATDLPGNS